MKKYSQYLNELDDGGTVINITVKGKPGSAWYAEIANLNGRQYNNDYKHMGLQDVTVGRSGWEALTVMAKNWQRAGFLD